MWALSGNLIFPWKPDYVHHDICAHNDQGEMLFVDHVSIEWIILPEYQSVPDILSNEHFDQLRIWFDGALQYMAEEKPSRIATWGFVTHITEYAKGSHAEYPLDPGSLAALDSFLDYVSSEADAGRVIFATVEEIADVIDQSN
jgi:hypothetical protein